MTSSYSSEALQILEVWEAIRKRPKMYIGSTDRRGIERLINEVINNSIEEAIAGYCNKIDICLNSDNSITVNDNGRGIPIDICPQTERSFLESVMTTLYARNYNCHNCYKVRGCWQEFGIAAVNALSAWTEVKVGLDQKTYSQRYERGIAVTALEVKPSYNQRNGTSFTFQPDPEIFGADAWVEDISLALRLQELAYLNAGVKITLTDRRHQRLRIDTYHYPKGLRDYLALINRHRQPLHEIIHIAGEQDRIKFEVVLQWYGDRHTDYLMKTFPSAALLRQKLEETFLSEQFDTLYLLGFANQFCTVNGGTHLRGVKVALTRTMNAIARQKNRYRDSDFHLSWFQVREGLTGIISVMLHQPEYNDTDPDRWELTNPEVQVVVEQKVEKAIGDYLQLYPSIADCLLYHFLQH